MEKTLTPTANLHHTPWKHCTWHVVSQSQTLS